MPKPLAGANADRHSKNKTANNLNCNAGGLGSELGVGGVSCLDVSDLSSGHASPTIDGKKNRGDGGEQNRGNLTEVDDENDDDM